MWFLQTQYQFRTTNLQLRCEDYDFDCEFILDEEKTIVLIKKFRNHSEEEHGIDYTIEAVTQMITNRGHSLESIRKQYSRKLFLTFITMYVVLQTIILFFEKFEEFFVYKVLF